MKPMLQPLRPFLAILFGMWLLLSIAAVWYSQQQHIPSNILWAALPAILLEAGFYLATGFESTRARIAALGSKSRIATWLWLTALAPYLVYSILSGTFQAELFFILAALVAIASFWYVVLPPHPLSDILFLALIGAAILAKRIIGEGFANIYLSPGPRVQIEIVGVLMWYRVAILSLLLLRPLEGVGFGFMPQKKEWRIGLQSFLLFLPVGYILNLLVGFAPYRTLSSDPVRLIAGAMATFLGMLWVQTVIEELLFRGMILQLLRARLGLIAAIMLSSIIFGLAHLPYRYFPNWKFVGLATVAGVFYGIAYARAGSIRASMVTHALVNTAWKVFFTG